MFTTNHFIWIALCALLITGGAVLAIKRKLPFRTAALIMAGISLASELSKIFSYMIPLNEDDPSMGMVVDPEALPLHLCSLLIFVFFSLPFLKNEALRDKLLSFAVPISLIGAPLAILMATSGVDFTDQKAYQCFVYHAAMVWFAVYLIATKQVKLGLRPFLRNVITLSSLALIMLWVNGALSAYETNFFFVVRPPAEDLPLLNLDHGWFAYFFTVIGLGLLGLIAVHIGPILKERRKSSASAG